MNSSWSLYRATMELRDAVPPDDKSGMVSCERLREHIEQKEMCKIAVRREYKMRSQLVRGILTREEGKAVIIIPKMNTCWTRFVMLKEMMHIILDSSADFTRNGSDLLSDMTIGSELEPFATKSENNAAGLAITYALSSPKRPKHLTSTMTAYEVAKAFRVPELFVSKFYAMLAPDFNEIDEMLKSRPISAQ